MCPTYTFIDRANGRFNDNMTFKMEFKEPMLNHFLRDWQSIKQLAELGRVSPEDYELWKNMRSSYTKAYTED